MASMSGKNGLIKIGALKAVEMDEWDLEATLDTEETAFMQASGWKAKVPMLSDWTANIKGKWDMTDATDTVQQDMMNNLLGLKDATMQPTEIAIDLYIDITAGSLKHYTGDCIIKSMSVKCPANGIVTVEFALEGNGVLAYSTT